MSLGFGPTEAAEWRNHWPVVLAAALGMMLCSMPSYSIGVFIPALEAEYGWKRAQIASGLIFCAVVCTLLGPVVGMAVDRFGPRRVGLLGAIAFITAFALLSATGPTLASWWALWTLVALAVVFVTPTVWTSAVASLFTTSRGLALAATLCGSALAAGVMPILSTLLIANFGWRVAYLGLAGCAAVLTLPAIALMFTSAIDQRRRAPDPNAGAVAALPGVSAREALTSFRFVRLLVAALLVVFVASNCIINFVPIAMSFGHPQVVAAGIAGLAGISTVLGRLTAGYLIDRLNGNVVAAVFSALPVVSCLLMLTLPGSTAALAAAVFILGLTMGTELDAVAYLVTRHFGLRSFGTVFGVIGGTLGLSGFGPLVINLTYDVTGSYVPALWGCIPLALLGSISFLTLGPYRDFSESLPPVAA